MLPVEDRRQAARRLLPVAVLVFVLAGVLLQAAILMSGYWQSPRGSPRHDAADKRPAEQPAPKPSSFIAGRPDRS